MHYVLYASWLPDTSKDMLLDFVLFVTNKIKWG